MTSWFNYWGHMCLIFELLGEDDDDDEDGDDGNDGDGGDYDGDVIMMMINWLEMETVAMLIII